jgi:hypothetical protein
MASWPASLPQKPLLGGWSWAPRDNRVSFQPDAGPAIERRRGTAVVHEYEARFPPLTKAQVAEFETFFEDTLVSGTLRYSWDDPVSGESREWRLREYSIAWSRESGKFDLTCRVNRMPAA